MNESLRFKKINKILKSFFKNTVISYINFSYKNSHFSFIGFICRIKSNFIFLYPAKVKNQLIEDALFSEQSVILYSHRDNPIINKISFVKIKGKGILIKKNKKLIKKVIHSISKKSPIIGRTIHKNFNSYYMIHIDTKFLEYNLINSFKKCISGIILKENSES